MSTRDINEQIMELYGVEISSELVNKVTDRIVPQIKEWENRPLKKVYPFIFVNAIHYMVREKGRLKTNRLCCFKNRA